jgi:hypothetical protein
MPQRPERRQRARATAFHRVFLKGAHIFVLAKFLVYLDLLVQSELKGSFFVSLLPLIVCPTVVSVQFVSLDAATAATALSNLATSFRVVLAILVT